MLIKYILVLDTRNQLEDFSKESNSAFPLSVYDFVMVFYKS